MSKSVYDYDISKRYNDKCKKYSIKYTLKELNIAEMIENELNKTGLTANSWIKQAISEKLKREGYLIEDQE